MRALLSTLAGRTGAATTAAGVCADCRYFCNDPATVEKAFPGLTSMGSGYADVRANDGLCERHGIYLALTNGCDAYSPAGAD